MQIDVTNLRLDQVSAIVQKMEGAGFDSRIERSKEQFLLFFDNKTQPRHDQTPQRILNW